MTLNDALIAEIQVEALSTRKMLERIPFDHADWAPHEHSMKLARLASHVAELPTWVGVTLNTAELDFGKREYKPYVAASAEELVTFFDKNVAEAVEVLKAATPEQFGETWTLRNNDHIIFSLPKAAVLRSFSLSHMYHHRGQLSVYLRLLNVPVPGMYGPSKDDQIAMMEAQAATN
ncbi:MAG: hypothetical protein EBZ77_05520 [Chitinophagia bacterium]|nr:hypothetical protein [Chitinophagia bacterium]